MSIGCGVVVSSWPNDSDRVDKVVRVFEVFMIRTLTILILSITQVLSGLGCGGYLCFHKDGTFCGVDGGAENCSCCDESAESADVCQGQQCCHEKLDHKCCAIAGNLSREADDHSDRQSSPNVVVTQDSLPCSCIHIPISVPAAKVERASEIGKLKSCCNPGSQPNQFVFSRNAGSGPPVLESLLPQTPQFRVLLQHRCVVIRC